MSNNRKRTKSRNIQTIRCDDMIVRKGQKVLNPEAGRLKQIKHPNIPE
jgi:hypothetical protein